MFKLPIGKIGRSLVTLGINTETGTKVYQVSSSMNANSKPLLKLVIPGEGSKNFGKVYASNFYNGKAVQLTEIVSDVDKSGKGVITSFSTYSRGELEKLVPSVHNFKIDNKFTGSRAVDFANSKAVVKSGDFLFSLGGKYPVAGIADSHQSIQVGENAVQVLQKSPDGILPAQTLEFDGKQLNWGRILS